MMIGDDNDGQMIFGDLGSQKLPDIYLTGDEKPRKNLTQETCPVRVSVPGPLRARLPPAPERQTISLLWLLYYLSILVMSLRTDS